MKNNFFALLGFASLFYLTACNSTTSVTKENEAEQNIIEYKNLNTYTASVKYPIPDYNLFTELKRVKSHYLDLKKYAAANNFSTDYIFVVDMRIPCFRKRFFVYNQKKDSLLHTALVSHGIGSETFKGYLIFSNTPDSRMSSLGKYKIGVSYTGKYGFSYRLHGLDSTNSNALKRAVVMHSYPTVPDDEGIDQPIVFSYGCPMVSPKFLQKLKTMISTQKKKPILLSIIY